MDATWELEHHGSVALATFLRPPRNLMSMAAMTELEQLVDTVSADDSVDVLVLTGGLDGYFVAHADTEDLARLGRGEEVEGDLGSWGRTFERLATMDQPVVAAVNGQAWGGGCELALACTMRVAAASAHFAQPEVLVGIIPGAGGTQRLPRIVGPGRAAEMILSARTVDAHEARAIGLVEAVLPDDDFVAHVLDWVAPIAASGRRAVTAAKRAILGGLELPLTEGLALEAALFLECQASPEAIALEEAVNERYAAADDAEPVALDPTPDGGSSDD